LYSTTVMVNKDEYNRNLNLGYLSLNVIQTTTIWKLGCVFLFAFCSNYGAILYRLRDIATCWSKVANFIPHVHLASNKEVSSSEIHEDVWYS